MAMLELAALAQDAVAPISAVPPTSFADQIIPIAVALTAAISIIMPTVLIAISSVRKLIAEVKQEQTTQAVVVKQLEVNTNSISEKLRAVIEEKALAEGNLAGRAELQAEKDAQDLAVRNSHSPNPVKVEVANPTPVPVVETKS